MDERVSLAHSTGVPRDQNTMTVSHDYQMRLKPCLQAISAKPRNLTRHSSTVKTVKIERFKKIQSVSC